MLAGIFFFGQQVCIIQILLWSQVKMNVLPLHSTEKHTHKKKHQAEKNFIEPFEPLQKGQFIFCSLQGL